MELPVDTVLSVLSLLKEFLASLNVYLARREPKPTDKVEPNVSDVKQVSTATKVPPVNGALRARSLLWVLRVFQNVKPAHQELSLITKGIRSVRSVDLEATNLGEKSASTVLQVPIHLLEFPALPNARLVLQVLLHIMLVIANVRNAILVPIASKELPVNTVLWVRSRHRELLASWNVRLVHRERLRMGKDLRSVEDAGRAHMLLTRNLAPGARRVLTHHKELLVSRNVFLVLRE